ncbi:Lrp/AsnC family transcriptional regulator [Pyrococcus yayanosii]|uniref:Transcription regulator protein, Lrp-Asn family n=1 Tax=Pyrococcus yayanosii (strain CH1 / JCM 16557) TaxID=529709 RepID=F8AGG3_PYRYC|nr:Lrp/AsnC family transcriptional regulator [Pyrococcus yayanosii]AEH25163.1 Transcription regulator protein, Lrp-Asn family [Pyrococcus yayanosii CH1]
MRKLDKMDLQLVKVLSQNSRLTYKELAELLSTTRQRVARRMEKLKRLGVIKKFTVIPNFEKLGYAYVILAVSLRPGTDINTIIERLQAREEVKIIEKGIGAHSLIIHVLVPKELKGAEERVEEIMNELKEAERIDVTFVSDVVKFELI